MYRKILILVVVLVISVFGFASVSLAQDATATPTATATATTAATAAPTAQATNTPQATSAPQATSSPQAMTTPQGTSPGNAGPVPSGGQTLAVGQQVWYRFNYAGDNTEIQVRMNTFPGGSANFSVWTEENVRNWQQGGPEEPIARGTPNEDLGGDLFWSGSFNFGGPFYIRVDQIGSVPANFNLSVTGTGVSSGQPSMAQATTQATAQPTAQATGQAQAAVPQTLPVTGGELPLVIAGLGALALAVGAGLRRTNRR